jgi:heme-degrading monooxygenase HmoA
MFVILWEFEVKPGSEERLQRAYGPEGAWVRLFQGDPHYRGTQLHRDPSRPLFYFTIDFWDSETEYENFLSANRAAYEEIDRDTQGLTIQDRPILSFTIPASRFPAT